MPLEILLLLVVGGIAGIAVVLHLSGRSNLRVLTPDSVRAEWARHFPEDRIIDATLNHCGHAALVRTDTGPGLLWSFGADTVGRRLFDFDWLDHPQGVHFFFHDFGAPQTLVRLDETERPHWKNLLRQP